MNIETKTINDLRTLSTAPAIGTYYFITNFGKEGEWYYAGTDTTTLDNTGTVLTSPSITDPIITTSRLIFKRVYDAGYVTATWFFENSDPDATLGIQRALDFISYTNDPYKVNEGNYGGGTVFIPKGIYVISNTLLVGENCRIVGANNRYHCIYQYNVNGGGTVLKAQFPENDNNKWIISSATYKIDDPSLNLLPFDIALSKEGGTGYNYNMYIYRMGISVENLTIDGGGNAFGAIRLSNAGNSIIRNVGAHNVKCGFMLNTCWGGAIENSFANFDWYGALIIECNSALIINCYFRGTFISLELPYEDQISESDLPNFIHQGSYTDWGLNDRVKFGKTGIYCFEANNVLINSTVAEFTSNAISCLSSRMTLISIHIEGIVFYGITIGIGDYTQILFDQIGLNAFEAAFYFGKKSIATLTNITSSISQLYLFNETSDRNITFTNTIYLYRKYFADILFTDECKEGQNFGSVYIDPANGNDENYGFNYMDAVKTFDAALIRVQNQSTINPVKVIRIKEGTTAIKDTTIKELENCSLLITGYTDGGEGLPNPAIYFDGEDFHIVGEMLLKGNVNLVFRNVNLICNSIYKYETLLNQFTIFSLKQTSSKITFENLTIDLTSYYSLIKSNDLNNAMVETKFINTNILGSGIASLSPSNGGTINLLVDNVQIGSNLSSSIYVQFNTGWLDTNTIRNNF